MNKIKNSPLFIFLSGTMTAFLLVIAALLFMNPPQCPANYTQEQVNASNCIIGANIGIGFVFMLAIGVWVTSIIVAKNVAASKRTKL
jgi:hypothetical protein